MEKVIYTDFIDKNIAPYAAKSIGVYDNATHEKVGEIPLTNEFKPEYGKRLYRFGLISDVHCDDTNSNGSDASPDLINALNFLNKKESIKFTCVCGDISMDGGIQDLEEYKLNLSKFSPVTPVYTTTGNHDCPRGGLDEARWEQYTGHKRCFEITENLTDHFLFFGMNSWSLGDSGIPYLESDIDWLEKKLEEYKNERCFIFTHLFFPDKAGNLNGIYPRGNWLGGSQLTRIQGLNEKYVNTVWFSGHSHWKWYLQKYEDKANVFRSYGPDGTPTCGWCVHVPSCAYPIDSNGSSRVEMWGQSEGAIVDVYENYIDIRGVTFKDAGDASYVTRYLPIADYRLETSIIKTYLKASDFEPTHNLNKTSAAVEDVGDGYVRVTFSQNNQALDIKGSGWKATPTGATLYVDDFIYETPVEQEWNQKMKDGVGFYCSDELDHRIVTNGAKITINEYGTTEILGDKDSFIYPMAVKFKAYVVYDYDSSTPVNPESVKSVPTAEDFTYNPTTAGLSSKYSVTNDTVKLGYIDINFKVKKSLKFFIKTKEMANANSVILHIDDVLVTAKGVDVTNTVDLVGFYTNDMSNEYVIKKGVYNNLKFVKQDGIEFNLSSRYQGNVPVNIKIKFWLECK